LPPLGGKLPMQFSATAVRMVHVCTKLRTAPSLRMRAGQAQRSAQLALQRSSRVLTLRVRK